MLRSPTHRFFAVAALLAATFAISCGPDITGPSHGGTRYARGLSFQPVFPALVSQAADAGLVPFTHVHIVLHHADGSIALDTVVDFPPDATELTLSLDVVLAASAPPGGEQLSLNLAYINAEGVTVFEGGPFPVLAAPTVAGGPPPPPVSIPVSYTGPGSTATSVVIIPHTLSVLSGDAFAFSAQAFDATGTALSGTPIVFTSSNPALAPLATVSSGSGTAAVGRGAVTITAQLLTGPSDVATLTIQPRPSAIALVSGSGQSAQVGSPVSSPLVVRVTATDGLGVSGVSVAFTPSGDGSALPTSAVTAADGTAQTLWTLGTLAGPQTLLATVSGLSGSPITFNATATPKPAAKLVFVTQPGNAQIGASLGNVTVAVQDASNNVSTTFTGSVSIGIGTNPGSAVLAGTATVNAVAGIATFSGLSLNKVGNGYTLVAASGALTGATSAAFNIISGPATRVEFSTQPSSAVAGTSIGTVQVTVRDISGNVANSYTGPVQVSISSNPGGSTLSGTSTVNAVAGVAIFTGLSLNKSGLNYTLLAGGTGLGSEVSSPFNVTAAAAASCSIVSGNNLTAPTGGLVSVGISAFDAFGNAVGGAAINAAVVSGGGVVSPASNTADATTGVATFAWTLGPTIGAQSLTATCAGVAAGVTVNATATSGVAGPATQLAFTVQPSNATAGIAISPAVVVTAKDAGNLTATTFTGNVTIAIGTNPDTATLGGTLTVAAVAGVATFNSLKLNHSGVGYTLIAASGVLTGATSATFNITPAPAITLLKSGGDAQTASTGTLLPILLSVRVSDSLGNAVPGVTINWTAATGGGSVGAPTSITNALGNATISWTLGATIGAQTATATAAGLAGSPATFTATGTLAGFSKTWNGSISTAWNTAGNWTPSGVPVPTDGVFIPVTANNPLLSSTVSVGNLSIAGGASLSLGAFTVNVAGNLTAGTTGVIGTGISFGGVNMNGAGTVMGVISNTTLAFSAPYSLAGTTTVTGAVGVSVGALTIGANTLTLTGDLSTTGTGTLVMTNAAGIVSVNGQIVWGGAAGTLSAGLMSLTGNFTLQSAPGAFTASANHTVAFNGTTLQGILNNGANPLTFGSVSVSNPAGVVLVAGFTTVGNIAIASGSGPVTGHRTVHLIGSTLSDAVGGMWQVDSLLVGGCGCTMSLPSVIHSLLIANGGISLGTSFSVDSMQLPSGMVTWNGQAVTVTGDFRTTGNGSLLMSNPGDQLTVNGNATFGGGVSNLNTGTTFFKGNFAQTAAFTGRSFQALLAHTTVLTGSGAQNISFATPDTTNVTCGSSCFGGLTINKTSGLVTFTTSSFTGGNLTVLAGATGVSAIGAAGSPKLVRVAGTTTTDPSVPVHFTRMRTTGSIAALGAATVVDSINFAGNATQTVAASTWSQVVISGTPTISGDLVSNGDMIVATGGVLTPNGHTVTVNGSFSTIGTGVLAMSNPIDSLKVTGLIILSGGVSAPSAGTIFARGDFSATGATFQATGSNMLIMSDTSFTTGQTLTYNAPVAGQGIRHLLFDGGGATTIAGNVNVMGDLVIAPFSHQVNGPAATVRIGGNFSDSTAFPDTVGAWIVANTEMFGTGTFINADFLSTNLLITGSVSLPVPLPALRASVAFVPRAPLGARPSVGSKSLLISRLLGGFFVQVNGTVLVSGAGASLDLNGNTLYVEADFGTASLGVLKMTDPFDFLFVAGSATFAGGSTAGMLTAGTMQVLVDFIEGGGAADAFSADVGFQTDVGINMGSSLRAASVGALRSAKTREAQSKNPRFAAAKQKADARVSREAAAHTAGVAQRDRRAQRLTALGIKVDPNAPLKPFRRAGAPAKVVSAIRLAHFTGATSNINFADPGTGAGASHFGDFYLVADIAVLSNDVVIEGSLFTSCCGHVVQSANKLVTSHGAAASNITFDNTRWSLLDGQPFTYADYMTFINMDPTVDQFTINRDGTSTTQLYGWDFETVPTSGHYISATDADNADPRLFLDMQFPFPALNGGFLLLQNGATSNWAATFEWTGLGATNAWSDGGNWSTGFEPFSVDDIIIRAGTPHDPQLTSYAFMHNITIESGVTIDLPCTGRSLLIYGNLNGPTTSNSIPTCEGEGVVLEGDGPGPNTVTGWFGVVGIDGNYNVSGQLIASNAIEVSGNLKVNGGRVDVGNVGGVSNGMFSTYTTGTLMMAPGDVMFVGSGGAYFEGGSTAGLLTGGTLTIVNGCVHGLPGYYSNLNTFAPSGTHTTVFSGFSNVEFTDPAQSFLQNAVVQGGSEMFLFTNVTVKGTLSRDASPAAALVTASSTMQLTTSGLNQSGIYPMNFTHVAVTFVDGTSNVTFDNVNWLTFGSSDNVFTVNRSGVGTLTFNNHDFTGAILDGGFWLRNLGTATVHMATPTPNIFPGGGLVTGPGPIIWP